MDITTLAAWGEFIGGIAVVVSLIYLASQIRQNSRLLRASIASTIAQLDYADNALAAQDPEMSRIWWAGMDDRSSLSESDRQRLDQFMTLTFRSRVQRYELARDGISSPLQVDLDERGFNWWMQKPGVQQYWQEYRALYPRELQDYVDRAIGQGEPTP